jgi:hypothetical protein
MRTYTGLLSLHQYGDAYDILFLSTVKEPLADELQWMVRKKVTVRYWVTDKQITKDEAQEEFLKTLLGLASGKFGSRYSEITGYLWTDEELNVGGHDLISELKSNIGKWLILEIEENA